MPGIEVESAGQVHSRGHEEARTLGRRKKSFHLFDLIGAAIRW